MIKYPTDILYSTYKRFLCYINSNCSGEDLQYNFYRSEKYKKYKYLWEKPILKFAIITGNSSLKQAKTTISNIQRVFHINNKPNPKTNYSKFNSSIIPIKRKVNQQGKIGRNNSFYSTAFLFSDYTPELLGVVKLLTFFLQNEAFTY